jgi:hypothetical protein
LTGLDAEIVKISSSDIPAPAKPIGYLDETGNSQANALGRLRKVSIPGDEYGFLVGEFECRREMNCVIPAQPQVFRVLARIASELLIDADRDQIRV